MLEIWEGLWPHFSHPGYAYIPMSKVVDADHQVNFFIVWASFYLPLGRTRCWGRCWAVIRLHRHPKLSGQALRGEVDGENIVAHMINSLFCLRHTHKLQKGPYSVCVSRIGNVRHRCAGG